MEFGVDSVLTTKQTVNRQDNTSKDTARETAFAHSIFKSLFVDFRSLVVMLTRTPSGEAKILGQ